MKRFLFLLLSAYCVLCSMQAGDCIDYTNLYSSNVSAMYGTFKNPYQHSGIHPDRHYVILTSTQDPNTGYQLSTTPRPDLPSIRLGNDDVDAEAESITYEYEVPEEGTILVLHYAVVLEDPDHSFEEQPRFTMDVTDVDGNSLDEKCLTADFIPKKNTADWETYIKTTGGGSWLPLKRHTILYKKWTTLAINLLPYKGQRIKISFETFDCSRDAHFGYAYFALECEEPEIAVIGCGDDKEVELKAPDGFYYRWYEKNGNQVLNRNQTYSVLYGSKTNEYRCELLYKEDTTCVTTLYAKVTKNIPMAQATLSTCGFEVSCTENTTVWQSSPIGEIHNLNIPCNNLLWDFGDGQTSTERNPVHTYTHEGTYTVTLKASLEDEHCYDEWSKEISVKPPHHTESLVLCPNELPRMWNDIFIDKKEPQDVPFDTILVYNGKSDNNCDSIVTLNLRILPIYQTDVVRDICEKELQHGIELCDTVFRTGTKSGKYVLARKSIVTGCDSIINLYLTVHADYEYTEYVTICADDLPYEWGDSIFDKAGIHTLRYESRYGCDSIVHLSLMVTYPYTYSDSIWLCQDDLPFSWRNAFIPQDAMPGIYHLSDTLVNSLGCDSIFTMKVTINPSYHRDTFLTVCAIKDRYEFGDTIFQAGTQSGKYVFNRKTKYACDSIVTLYLTILPSYDYTEYVTVCEDDLPYPWHGKTYDSTNVYTDTLVTANGCCDSIVHLSLVVAPPYTHTDSIFLCQDDLPYAWYDYRLLQGTPSGVYPLSHRQHNPHGCDSVFNMKVTIYPSYARDTFLTICSIKDKYQFGDTIFQAGTKSGKYVFNRKTQYGCDSIVTLYLTINPTYDYTITEYICKTELPYEWGDTTFATGGLFTIYETTQLGCDSIIHLDLRVQSQYIYNDSIVLCQDDLPFIWRHHSIYQDAAPGVYCLTDTIVEPHACDSIFNMKVTVHPSYARDTFLTICPIENSFKFGDTIFQKATQSGKYVIANKSPYACDSIMTLYLTVHKSYNYTIYKSIHSDELPYDWNGQLLHTNGLYTYETTTLTGCDSIIHLNLTVNDSYKDIESITICQNELPLYWNGYERLSKTATADTTYIFTDTISKDSIFTLQVKVLPMYHIEESATICPIEDSWGWRDTTFLAGTKSGKYIFHRKSQYGCDSIVTLNLKVLPRYEYSIVKSICENDLPYEWGDTLLKTAGIHDLYYETIDGCDSIIHLHLKLRIPYRNISSTEICYSEISNYEWRGQRLPIEYDDTTYMLTDTISCDSIFITNVQVIPLQMIADTLVLCSSEFPYLYRDTVFEVGTQTGKYVWREPTEYGCENVVTLYLKVLDIKEYATSLRICRDELPYTWGDTIFKVGTQSGVFKIRRQSIEGCDSVITLNLIVGGAFETTESLILCSHELPYNWRGNIIDSSMPTGIYTYSDTTATGCDSIVHLDLTIFPSEGVIDRATICASELPYHWRDTILDVGTESGVYSFNRMEMNHCDVGYTLVLYVNDTNIIHLYDEVYSDSIYDKNGFYYVAQRNLEYKELRRTLQNSAGCDSTVILHLDILSSTCVGENGIGLPSKICADENSFDISFSQDNMRYLPDSVELVFDDDSRKAGFVNFKDELQVGYVTIPIPQAIIPNIYTATMYLIKGTVRQALDIKFMICYPASIIEQHWNDVLALQNETKNGGYSFAEYQWYKNDIPLFAETHSYLYVGPQKRLDMDAEYTVEIRRNGEEIKIFTCPIVPTVHEDVTLYPTLVGRSEIMKMPIIEHTLVEIYSLDGRQIVHDILTQDHNVMIAPSASGAYIVRLECANKEVTTYKMIVK